MDRESRGQAMRVGAVWDDASSDWAAFFPEDLPEDWRLPFYAHYWKVLLLPSKDWARMHSDPLWLSDLPEDLNLYFEIPPSGRGSGALMATLTERLGLRLGGFLVGSADCPVPSVSREYLFARVPFPSVPGALRATAYAGDTGAVCIVEPQPGLALRDRRALLEALVQALPGSARTLFLKCDPKALEDSETILRLIGRV
jgi:hypothetical protein